MEHSGYFLPEPDQDILKPEIWQSKPDPVKLNDLTIRLVCIPFFGLAIPNISGLIQNSIYPLWQLGMAYGWFVFIAFAIWQGNRFLLFRLREKFSWLNHPVQKIISLFLANVLYTIPLCYLLMITWYRFFSHETTNWSAIALATSVCVICVIFITYIYELVFLAKQWEVDKQYSEKLQVTLNKFLVINNTTQPGATALIEEKNTYRQRLLLKRGSEFVSLPVQDIAYCFTLEKITFIMDRAGERYMAEQNLAELELLLDPALFYRANRQHLVHITAIHSFKTQEKGKLKLAVLTGNKEGIVVSQENAAAFKTWLQQ